MILHKEKVLTLCFGAKQNSLERSVFESYITQEKLFEYTSVSQIKDFLNFGKLFFLKQIHNNLGIVITLENIYSCLTKQISGDFLVTQLSSVGLAVYTADCLPIIFFDIQNYVIAICHAGWAGSLKGVAVKTVESMQKNFKTKYENLRIYFGPSAKSCCYEVGSGFLKNIEHLPRFDEFMINDKNKIFFDIPSFNRVQLEIYFGLKKENFNTDYNICTICDAYFCSSRRDKDNYLRQLTVVTLNNYN